jgi:hypothetical protein
MCNASADDTRLPAGSFAAAVDRIVMGIKLSLAGNVKSPINVAPASSAIA